MKTVAASPALYFTVLRHRTLSPTIYLSEVTDQALRLIVNILLIQRRKKHPSREEKNAFPQ